MKEEVTLGFYTLGTGQPTVEAKPEMQGQLGPHTAAELYPRSFNSSVELNPASNDPG